PKRFRFTGTESYVKSEKEMLALFGDHPETLQLTQSIADRCEFDFEQRYFVPSFPLPDGVASDDELLRTLTDRGLESRYGSPLPQAVVDRRDYELGVISEAGYSGY